MGKPIEALAADMAALEQGASRRRAIVGFLGAGAGVALAHWPLAAFTPVERSFLGLLLAVVVFWAAEVVPAGVGGLILMIGAVLAKIAPVSVAFAGFANPVLWLIVGGLVLGAAASESGLGKRLAYLMLRRVRADRPWQLVLEFFLAGAILTQMIPTVFGRLAILLPLGIGIAENLGIRRGSRYGKFLLATVFFASQGPYLATMTGFEPTLAAIGALARAGYPVYWGQYLGMWIVPGLLLTSVMFYACIMLLFAPERREGVAWDAEFIRRQLEAMGPLSKRERKVLVIFGLVILLWVTGSWTHLSPDWVAVFGMVALFLPGVEAVTLEDVRRHVNLLNIIFFASALSIGPILGHIHLSAQIARLMAHWIPSTHLNFLTALELGALVQFLHVPLSTVTSAMATVSPIFEHYAVVQHVSPVIATWIVVASASAYLFPYQNEPLLMAYGEGYWTMWDMLKQGIFVSLVTLLLVPIFTVTWWAWTVH